MKQRIDGARARHIILRGGFVALMLGLIVFSIYQLTQHVTAGAQTLRTQVITDRSYLQLDLYVFRDETVLTADQPKLFVYQTDDGEKVGAGDTLSQVYTTDEGEAGRSARQAALNDCGAQLERLYRSNRTPTPTDVEEALQTVDRQYVGMLSAADRGQMSVANGFAAGLTESLGRYQGLIGTAENVGDARDRLLSEQQALLDGCVREGDATTDVGGYFYHSTDGYESVFPYGSVMTMTPAEFQNMTESVAQAGTPGTVMGKLVRSSIWYAVAYVTAEEAEYLAEGEAYVMTCRNSSGTEISMTVCRMETDDIGVLVVFESQQMPEGFSFDRRLSVQTVAEEVSGYRVPSEAVVTRINPDSLQKEDGVYVLEGTVVEFRRVLIRRTYENEGYCIVRTESEADAYLEEHNEQGGNCLSLNDLILLTPAGLSEGDILK